MGARKVLALINRAAYVDLMQGDQLDIALSPAQVTIGGLLAHIRRGDVVAVHPLRRGAAEALEIVAHGDMRWSSIVGRRIQDIELPPGVTIGALVRGLPATRLGDDVGAKAPPNGNIILARQDTVIESADHLILFVTDKRTIPKVEKLFQVGVGYL
jgi:trk system potassium uptake protein TrkA